MGAVFVANEVLADDGPSHHDTTSSAVEAPAPAEVLPQVAPAPAEILADGRIRQLSDGTQLTSIVHAARTASPEEAGEAFELTVNHWLNTRTPQALEEFCTWNGQIDPSCIPVIEEQLDTMFTDKGVTRIVPGMHGPTWGVSSDGWYSVGSGNYTDQEGRPISFSFNANPQVGVIAAVR